MNSLFNQYGQNQNGFPQQQPAGNNFIQNLSNAANLLRQSNQTPQQMVQSLLQSGKMTQEQFNQYRSIANLLTGKNI